MKLTVPTSYPYCSKVQTLPLIPAIKSTFRRHRWARMDSTVRRNRPKHKVVVIMGATGTGKSKLSIDLATRLPAEIINCDKIQVYSGLDITTNKIQMHERQGVPHHLLGDYDSSHAEITPSLFRSVAAAAISDISSRRKLPVLAGGSNSFIHALLVDRYDSESDPFNGSDSVSTELRYHCCFLWIDVSFAVLSDYLSKRVDEMLDSGMLEELAKFYDPDEDESRPRTGLRKAIGVPEFDKHFRKYPPVDQGITGGNPKKKKDDPEMESFEEAVKAIKDNTCHLAKRQIGKILRLRGAGWDLKRLDATEAFRLLLSSDSGKKSSEIWEKQVVEPSMKYVRRFLKDYRNCSDPVFEHHFDGPFLKASNIFGSPSISCTLAVYVGPNSASQSHYKCESLGGSPSQVYSLRFLNNEECDSRPFNQGSYSRTDAAQELMLQGSNHNQ